MTLAAAETLALKALNWLGSRTDDLGRFLTTSGLDAPALRARASDRDLLLAVVDYVLMDEKLAINFCESAEISSRDLRLAHHLLSAA